MVREQTPGKDRQIVSQSDVEDGVDPALRLYLIIKNELIASYSAVDVVYRSGNEYSLFSLHEGSLLSCSVDRTRITYPMLEAREGTLTYSP